MAGKSHFLSGLIISENKRISAILSMSDDLANGRDEVVVSSGLRIIELESEKKALQEKLKESEHLKELAQYDTVNLQKEVERLKDEVILADDAYLNLKKENETLSRHLKGKEQLLQSIELDYKLQCEEIERLKASS